MSTERKHVHIMLSYYNGRQYIGEQLDSILSQKDVDVTVSIRNDGSSDSLYEVLSAYSNDSRIQILEGVNLGYAKSFMTLLQDAPDADYYAFSDQDDVWLDDKLIYGILKIDNLIMTEPQNKGILYCSGLTRVDEKLNFLSHQRFKNLVLTLGAEFTRHRLAGCTFIFDKEFINLAKQMDFQKLCYIPHDFFLTTLAILNNQRIIFDETSKILFRRHGNNTSADGLSVWNKIKKEVRQYTSRGDSMSLFAKALLDTYGYIIDEQDKQLLQKLVSYKKSWKHTISLCTDRRLNSGFWFFNVFIKGIILLRKY